MSTIDGTSTNDTLIGTKDADFIDGGAGKDNINAGDGNDSVIGGTGSDTLIYRVWENQYKIGSVYYGSTSTTQFVGNDVYDGGTGPAAKVVSGTSASESDALEIRLDPMM